eukprot:scaffold498588_cov37-Prasinocladus_malaysianus.AAC.1
MHHIRAYQPQPKHLTEPGWLAQARRLCLLCASVLGGAVPVDSLTQSASARLLAVLTDPTAWKYATAGEPEPLTTAP